jgi:hypothetical protein
VLAELNIEEGKMSVSSIEGKPGWRAKDYSSAGLEQAEWRLQEELPYAPVAAYSTFSSYCYSYATNCVAKRRYFKSIRLLGAARDASDRMMRFVGWDHRKLTADQLDIRASIYKALWKSRMRLWPWYRKEALWCVEVGLCRQNLKPHTEALLLCTRGELLLGTGRAWSAFNRAESLLRAIERSGELEQLIRVLRKLADFHERFDHPDQVFTKRFRERADQLARETGATDQLLKLGAES